MKNKGLIIGLIVGIVVVVLIVLGVFYLKGGETRQPVKNIDKVEKKSEGNYLEKNGFKLLKNSNAYMRTADNGLRMDVVFNGKTNKLNIVEFTSKDGIVVYRLEKGKYTLKVSSTTKEIKKADEKETKRKEIESKMDDNMKKIYDYYKVDQLVK